MSRESSSPSAGCAMANEVRAGVSRSIFSQGVIWVPSHLAGGAVADGGGGGGLCTLLQ